MSITALIETSAEDGRILQDVFGRTTSNWPRYMAWESVYETAQNEADAESDDNNKYDYDDWKEPSEKNEEDHESIFIQAATHQQVFTFRAFYYEMKTPPTKKRESRGNEKKHRTQIHAVAPAVSKEVIDLMHVEGQRSFNSGH